MALREDILITFQDTFSPDDASKKYTTIFPPFSMQKVLSN